MYKTVFHEDWWLDAVCPGRWSEVKVGSEQSGGAVWRFTRDQRWGFTYSDLPPFTRFLDPFLTNPDGIVTHRQIEHALEGVLEALPKFGYFRTGLGPGWTDLLILMDYGYGIRVHQTLTVDGKRGVDAAFAGLSKKTRSDVRRATSRFRLEEESDPERFVAFYKDNLLRQGRRNVFDFNTFSPLSTACLKHGAGQMLIAYDENGTPQAATFSVWDDRRSYQLLSTSNPEGGSLASSLLTWKNLEAASQRGQVFDMDGVTSASRLRFLSHFGGVAENRFLIERGRPMHRLGQEARNRVARMVGRRGTFTGDASKGGV